MISAKTVAPKPTVKVIMEYEDAERIADMLSHMWMSSHGPLGRTLNQLDDALAAAGIEWDVSESPFEGEVPRIKEGR